MNKNIASNPGPLSRARFNSLYAIAATGLLLWGLGTGSSRADILYVADGGVGNVVKVPSSGVSSLFASTGLFSAPGGLAFDSAGNLYVATELNHTIERFTPGGVGSVFADASDGVTYPRGLAFDSAGNIFVSNAGNNTIVKITPAGVPSVFFAGTGPWSAQGLAFDSAGNLYAAIDHGIEKFTPNGVRSFFASSGNGIPEGLAFDSAGNLYAANHNTWTIDKFTPGGTRSLFASSGLSQPFGLAFDSAGNLYAANNGNSTVEKFTPDGVGSVFASYESSGLIGPTFLAFTNDAGVPLLQPGGRMIPEPSTWAMLATGAASLLGFRRRSRN